MLAPRRLARLLSPPLLAVGLAAPAACRSKSPPPPGGRPAGSAAPAVAGPRPAEPACRDVAAAGSLTLGSAADAPASDEEGEVELPFAVELGRGRAGSGVFAVGGIESRGGGSYALLARVSTAKDESQTVELGRVHGDVEPPAVALFRDRVLIAIPNSDAGGVTLRLAVLAPPFTPGALRKGPELTGVRRDASGFALETSGERALLAFSELHKGRGRIALAVIDAEAPSLRGSVLAAPEPLGGADGEVEAPRLARRASGYYLAYIARTPGARRAARAETDAGISEALLDEGASAIEIVPLDLDGRATARPARLTPPRANVIAFELAPAPGGGALVTYSDDKEGPGLDRASLQAVHVRPDGSFRATTWEVGASSGLASVLVDPEPPNAAAWAWIGLSDERATRIFALGDDPLVLDAGAPAFDAPFELLSALGGRFLSVRARGRQRELSVVTCRSR